MDERELLSSLIHAGSFCISVVEISKLTEEKSKQEVINRLDAALKGFDFCLCKNCENLEFMAHSDRKNRFIFISKKSFEQELKNGRGLFMLIYAVIHEYLHILHPYSTEKAIEYKTGRYFTKAMKIMARDGAEAFSKELGVF